MSLKFSGAIVDVAGLGKYWVRAPATYAACANGQGRSATSGIVDLFQGSQQPGKVPNSLNRSPIARLGIQGWPACAERPKG